jgi:hypothetical protein
MFRKGYDRTEPRFSVAYSMEIDAIACRADKRLRAFFFGRGGQFDGELPKLIASSGETASGN